MKSNKLKFLFLFAGLLIAVFFFVYYTYSKPLAYFDLGNNRVVRITTDYYLDPNNPIYCELLIKGELVDKKVIEYQETGKYSVLWNYDYELISDKSKEIFAIVQIAPVSSQSPIAVFDFNEDFGYPVCPHRQCLDCHGGYCSGNSEMCYKKSNEVMKQIEKDNLSIKFKKYEGEPPQGCGSSN